MSSGAPDVTVFHEVETLKRHLVKLGNEIEKARSKPGSQRFQISQMERDLVVMRAVLARVEAARDAFLAPR